ncbi:hypothetical protein K8R33_03075 [archaeon]|nr:hypothetical protein [archaeon]
MEKTLKNILLCAALAGTLMTTGCNKINNKNTLEDRSSETTFVTTAENVSVKPYYGEDPVFMDGITVTTSAYGNGLDVDNIEESVNYARGSPEYKALRPLLTVEHPK